MELYGLHRQYGVVKYRGNSRVSSERELVFESDNALVVLRELEKVCPLLVRIMPTCSSSKRNGRNPISPGNSSHRNSPSTIALSRTPTHCSFKMDSRETLTRIARHFTDEGLTCTYSAIYADCSGSLEWELVCNCPPDRAMELLSEIEVEVE